MVKHRGYRTKTRGVFRKNVRNRGLKSLRRFLISYNVGDKVDIIGDPSQQKRGFPHRHFHGKTGTIVGKRGRCYEVSVKDLDKLKMIIVGREHIRLNVYHASDPTSIKK